MADEWTTGDDHYSVVISSSNSFVGDIDPKTANFLQSVACETVQEYFGK